MTEYSALLKRRSLIQASLLCDTVPATIAQPRYGYVHSVFQHACNIGVDLEIILTLQTRNMPLAPGGCILPVDDMRPLFCQGERVNISACSRLIAQRYEIELADIPHRTLRLNRHSSPSELISLHQNLLEFLPHNAPTGGMYDMLYPFSDESQTAMLSIDILEAVTALKRCLYKNADIVKLQNILCRLVGIGNGLTPSADDFLLGVLLVMDACNDPSRRFLVKAMLPLLSRTTTISSAMLAHGCAGYYGSQLLALFDTPDTLSPQIFAQVADYGHSSGHDMLCGIAFMLELAGRNNNKKIG